MNKDNTCENCVYFNVDSSSATFGGYYLEECIHQDNLKQGFDYDNQETFTETMNDPDEINANLDCRWFERKKTFIEEIKTLMGF